MALDQLGVVGAIGPLVGGEGALQKSGRDEVYVQGYPEGGRRLVSNAGGTEPAGPPTAQHLAAMLEAQGLQKRGILPGDAVFVYTGWGDRWTDPDTEKVYYSMAPGFSYDAVKWLGEKRVVVVGLDTPFIDPVAEGQLAGKVGPAPGTHPGFAYASHQHLLVQRGILLIENAKLDEIARDRVCQPWTSCTLILPLREKGSAGSPVRPVAIGVPGR